MNKLFFFTVTAFVALVSNSVSATLSVLPGTSIQAKIDQAQPGDTVAIFGGTYNEDININKAIRLVEVSGQQVNITGNITFTGIANAPIFEGFQVGSSARGITVSNTTGLILRNIVAADFVNVSGASSVEILSSQIRGGSNTSGTSTTRIKDCQISGAINMSGSFGEIIDSTCWRIGQYVGTLNVFKCSVSDYIDTGTGAQKTVVFRTTLAGDAIMRSKKVWFGYCTTRSFNFYDQSNAKVVVVGCVVDRQNGEANGLYFTGTNCEILVANNIVKNVVWGGGGDGENGLDGRGAGNTYIILNNYFSLRYNNRGGSEGAGVYLRNSIKAKILNNVVENAHWGILAGFGVVAKNNFYYNMPWNTDGNGVTAEGLVKGDPKFVAGQVPTLAADSPCLNAGVDDPIYANRDGSRNTIGPSGGTLYDPDARTTENPVVISFDLGPEQVLEGEATEILLSNGQAVSQP